MARPKKSDSDPVQPAPTAPSAPSKPPLVAKAPLSPLKNQGLLAARASLDKDYGKLFKTKDSWRTTLDPNALTQSIPHLSTGSFVLDYLIGGKPNQRGIAPCPGYPRGKVINVYGPEASGKTTLAIHAAVEAIKQGGCAAYIDCEHEFSPMYAQSLGIPIHDETRFLLCQPATFEEAFYLAWTFTMAGVDLVVYDSVGAALPRTQSEQKTILEEGRIGLMAGLWSKYLPKLKIPASRSKSIFLGISQTRDNIASGGYGESKTVQGGNAWKYYSNLRIYIRPSWKEKEEMINPLTGEAEEKVIGIKARVKMDKNKVSGTQGQEEEIFITWGKGVDNLRTLFEIAKAYGIIRQGGAWYEWDLPDGRHLRFQGLPKFMKELRSDPNYLVLLQEQVKPKLDALQGQSSEDEEELPEDQGADGLKLEDLRAELAEELAEGVKVD